MLRITLSTLFILAALGSQAQTSDLTLNKASEKAATAASTVKNNKTFHFVLPANLSTTAENPGDHFFGEEIAGKWAYLNSIYVRRQEVEVGFGAAHTEIYKPAVFNAINRLNRHYRRQSEPNNATARAEFLHALNCAIAVFFEEDTDAFEQALSSVRKPEELLQVFQATELSTR